MTTYPADNNYPDDGKTGKSLQLWGDRSRRRQRAGGEGLLRPSLCRWFGSGQLAGFSGNWERYYIGWFRQSGYDVTYSTNLETHTDGARLQVVRAGVANRVRVGYKSESDPVKDSTATVLWRDPLANRPEQSLVGVQSTAHLKNEGAGAVYIVQNGSHWVGEGTGLATGSRVYGILGYETDRLMSTRL